jgi:transposase
MGRIKRSFDHAFKIRITEAIDNGARTVLEICQQYQLQRQTVERWLSQYISGELQAKSKMLSRDAELERENEKLRAKIGELTMQIDALKKVENFKRSTRSDGSWIISSKGSDPAIKLAKPLVLPAPVTTRVQKERR